MRAYPACPIDAHPLLPAAPEEGDRAVRSGGGEVEGVEVWSQAVSLGQGEIGERRGACGRVVEGALYGELLQQGLGTDLVQARGGRFRQDALQVASAVKALNPPADGRGQAAQHDGPEGVHAVLEGVLVADDAPEGGLHTWPHGGKVSMPEQDPEPVRRWLWITKAPEAACGQQMAGTSRSEG
ncbi:hypothetical protein [Nonomuraea sp. NPDC049784]|uniref:hypothetical protein n=1 Tax=Nonomuraea sp. NPDC049784 TaxID=3154361 RepID=UPI0033E0CE66